MCSKWTGEKERGNGQGHRGDGGGGDGGEGGEGEREEHEVCVLHSPRWHS